MTAPTRTPIDTLLGSLAFWTWIGIDQRRRRMVQLLLAHPPARRDYEYTGDIAQDMRGLASALGLCGPEEPVPDLGPCLSTAPGSRVILRIDSLGYAAQFCTDPSFVHLIHLHQSVSLIIGTDPLTPHSPRADVGRYLADGHVSGRLRYGTAQLRTARLAG